MSGGTWDDLMEPVDGAGHQSDEQALAMLLSTFQGDAPVSRQLADGMRLSAWRREDCWVLVLRPASGNGPGHALSHHAGPTADSLFRAALQRRWRRAGALDRAHVAMGGDGTVYALCRLPLSVARAMIAQAETDIDALSAILAPMRKLLDDR